ncbi:Calmodulin (EF-Hand superfamily) [Phytophthora cinnamomi]|nr:Calmodulin (EF-Hand superfamily) [Phytophthora cinnamomi]
MNGWEEVFDAEGQTYYYHEVDGTTQWDPPQLQTQMASMLSKLGGGQQNLSADEQIARVFRQYDADESGEMTLDEFQHFYRALLGRGAASGGGVSDAQIRQVFSVLDASGDGSVTLEEFQFWWKTKLQLEVQETNEVETITREQRRREICREFLENADAIVLSSASNLKKEGDAGSPNEQGSQVCFESNMLPRVVALLGEFPLRGLAYRRALNELVADPMEQLVSLERFLVWYDRFESAEREKMELQRAKQRAQAELRAQHEAQAAARDKQRRRRKQMRTLNVMNDQAAAMTEHETQQQRDKKIAVLFKTFDTDGSGLLDEDELLQLTKALGHDMDAAQVNRMMKVMDSSGDGRINLEEFLAFWKAFEHRHPAPVSAAMLNQTRRDAVSEPATAVEAAPPPQPLSTSDAVASLAVNLEMVKDRALKLTLADLKGFLSDWRDDVVEKRIEQQAEHDEAEALKKWQITNQDVAKLCHDKFEDLEDEDACFLAMAKAKLRKQHYNPTPNWTFAKILELVERNPLDEAVIQRSLHATNEKLGAMLEAEQQSSTNNQEENRKGYGTVVDTVTLDSDLMLVRTVHQIMYEFPSNPRLQLLGQAVLSKLLPSAYVRAAYKAKIDPYFNL